MIRVLQGEEIRTTDVEAEQINCYDISGERGERDTKLLLQGSSMRPTKAVDCVVGVPTHFHHVCSLVSQKKKETDQKKCEGEVSG